MWRDIRKELPRAHSTVLLAISYGAAGLAGSLVFTQGWLTDKGHFRVNGKLYLHVKYGVYLHADDGNRGVIVAWLPLDTVPEAWVNEMNREVKR